MKNIHLLPTDKPSRLRYNLSNVLVLTKEFYRDYGTHLNQNIYIISDEEIKPSDYYLWKGKEVIKANDIEISFHPTVIIDCKKIILTTDQDLIKDGVQVIDDEFLEWYINNPSCEEVEVKKICNNCGNINCIHAICKSQIAKTKGITYKIIIPKEESNQESLVERMIPLQLKYNLDMMKQETLEEAAETELRKQNWDTTITLPFNGGFIEGFQQGAKWMQERMYSEEEVLEIVSNCDGSISQAKKWFEQFKNKQNCLQIK